MSLHASYNAHKATTPTEIVTTSVKLVATSLHITEATTTTTTTRALSMAAMPQRDVEAPDVTLQFGAATVLQYTVNNPYSLVSPVRMVLKVIPALPEQVAASHDYSNHGPVANDKADSPLQFSTCIEHEGGAVDMMGSRDDVHSNTAEGLTDTSSQMNASLTSQELLLSPRGVSKSARGSPITTTATHGDGGVTAAAGGHCFTVVPLFRSPLVFPLPVMYGVECAKELAGLPRLRIGGVCCEAHPLTVVNIIFEVTGITVAGADMFTNNKACCSVWARSEEDAQRILDAINKRVWMGPYNDGCAFRAVSESGAEFFQECLAHSLTPGRRYHFPKHFMTVTPWTMSPPPAASKPPTKKGASKGNKKPTSRKP